MYLVYQMHKSLCITLLWLMLVLDLQQIKHLTGCPVYFIIPTQSGCFFQWKLEAQLYLGPQVLLERPLQTLKWLALEKKRTPVIH